MRFAFQLFICFGVPLSGIFLYHKLFAKVKDNTVFKIGLAATINYLLIFLQIATIRFWGMSGMNLLALFYLICIAPILSIGFIYWIWRNKNNIAQYQYTLTLSVSYLAIISIFIIGIFFSHKS